MRYADFPKVEHALTMFKSWLSTDSCTRVEFQCKIDFNETLSEIDLRDLQLAFLSEFPVENQIRFQLKMINDYRIEILAIVAA